MGGIASGLSVSRRGYLSIDELQQFADITVTDEDEAADQISQAEEIIDAYIRRVPDGKFLKGEKAGVATGGTTSTLIDTSSDSPFSQYDDYFKGCEVEIIGGANEGERRRISGYDKDTQTITVADVFSAAIDATSAYLIRQLGLFPRGNAGSNRDARLINSIYYKRIPEAIKRAVAAQVEYLVEKGDSHFKGGADFKSESIDDYSYERAGSAVGIEAMIAPKARLFLKGYKGRTGRLIAENPTTL